MRGREKGEEEEGEGGRKKVREEGRGRGGKKRRREGRRIRGRREGGKREKTLEQMCTREQSMHSLP